MAVRITISPLMAPVFLPAVLPDARYAALIFSSETGVDAYAARRERIAAMAFCVGDRTAEAAQKLGLRVMSAGGDADAMIALILRHPPDGPLLHLRGKDSRAEVAARLSAEGMQTTEVIVYEQRPNALRPAAQKLLGGTQPVIVPLFSPRSALLFCATAPRAPLRIAAMSIAVAQAIDPRLNAQVVVAARPAGDAMLAAVGDLLTIPASA